MIGVAIDVDDTILDTRRRMQRAWYLVLNYDVPIDSVENLSSKEIVERYGSSRHYLWERFWRVLLCLDDSGVELLELDEPLPFAVDVLRGWSRQYVLLYLTGRPQTMRDLTLRELGRFGFPVDKTQLAMLTIQDWLNYFAGTSLNSQIKARTELLATFLKRYQVMRVVDDEPRFFSIYKQLGIPDRVGLLRTKRFSSQDYHVHGATRVIESWKELRTLS